jgi:superfamily II DNA or RNA helicase/HKD family nuclease/diadenosine tetraphosphate (Ap4A) HIT family hydrolase
MADQLADNSRPIPTPASPEIGDCEFCAVAEQDAIYSGTLVRALWDRYPVSPGHVIVITRRHVKDWFDATPEERTALLTAVEWVRELVEAYHTPDGYNIGTNVGTAAGQTVPHLHLHVIPRYWGDVPDPIGGVRFVVPAKANYLASPSKHGAPHARALVRGADDPLLPHLVAHVSRAVRVDIAVAFTMVSGVKLLIEHLRDVVARGGQVRLLTGSYMLVTEPDALRRLLDVGESLELRVFDSPAVSFHLKSYICAEPDGRGTAFVGSSNLSQSALKTGVEWNYRVVTSRDGAGFVDVCEQFELLYHDPSTRVVDSDWVTQYELRRGKGVVTPVLVPEAVTAPEPAEATPTPHELQQEALVALQRTRAEGNQAGLVVLATGLGKTWLAAFDSQHMGARRVLFVAHREEILDQAMRTFRTIRPGAALGRYTGLEKEQNADVMFASVQTLGRSAHLERFESTRFDYVVVDEFHHAAAATYRRLLDYFRPRFLLGLTATPERTDGADLLALCGENLVYRADLVDGIRRGLLCPFDYYGVPDEVDYSQIPWRSRRFDEESLTTAVATEARASNALDQLKRRGGLKTLAFCVSQRHADFMRRHFSGAGLRAAAVHAGETSDPRARSLERLQSGEIDVLFAVDMFNEGVDIPDIDTVLMLRPTESPVLWLQQFGRGLRWRPGKRLKVIDYIGNHRTFLLKPRTLFQVEGGDAELTYALQLLEEGRGEQLLPPGCSVTYDLEAKDILRALIRSTDDALPQFYREFRERTGSRPTASETFHSLLDPRGARTGYGSWFQFVRVMGDLTPAQDALEPRMRHLLKALEATPMTRSFKMLVLLAMLAEGKFPGAIDIKTLATRVRTLALRSANLREEFGASLQHEGDMIALLEAHPIPAWVDGKGTGGTRFFHYAAGVFGTTVDVEGESAEAAAGMVRELAEWRLAMYLRRTDPGNRADTIVCRVARAGNSPILFLPNRERMAGLPEGWVNVTADGDAYHAKFVKIAVNVLQSPNTDENVLPEVLGRWFGPDAGMPGRAHFVEFVRSGGGYLLAPTKGELVAGPRHWMRYHRAEVPKLFGFEFKGFESQSGVVEREKLVLLFVTLDKAGKPEEHRYDDAFLSAQQFRWQSQNRTTRDSAVGKRIAEHAVRGINIHLFVRRHNKVRGVTQPFLYCGRLTFDSWEGDKPITVEWKLHAPVPERFWGELLVPSGSVGL